MTALESDLTADDVTRLPMSWQGSPPGALIDLNGHLNHMAYIELGVASYRPLMHGFLGFGPAYVETRGFTTFVADQHITYRAEIRAADEMSTHALLHRVSERSLTVRAFLLNRTSGLVAALMDMTVVHVGVETRRAAPFPDDVRERLRLAQADPIAALAALPHPPEWYVVRDAAGVLIP